MKLTKAVQKISDCCKTEANRVSYVALGRSLVDFFERDPEIETITPEQMIAYADHLKTVAAVNRPGDRPLSVSTRCSYLKRVRALFNKLVADGLIPSNPAARVVIPSPSSHKVKAISLKNQRAMIAAAKINLRDYAVLRLFAATGARLSEIVGLTVGDVEIGDQGGRARIVGKGSKERLIFFKRLTAGALRDYLSYRQATDRDPLFTKLRPPYDAMTPRAIENIFILYAGKLGIERPFMPHSFRHCFAKQLIANGADLRTVADLMGHSDPAFTARVYLQWTEEELEDRYNQFFAIS